MRKLSSEEVYTITSSLAVLLQAGISLQEGFSILQDEATGKYKEVLGELYHEMEDGASLHQAMTTVQAFPQYAVDMTQVGESTGCLDQVMEALSKYYEREMNMKEQLKTVIMYPFMLLMMMFLVVAILVFKVLPIFQDVLQSLGGGLSGFALTFMQVGKLLAQIGFIALLLVLIIIFIVWIRQKKQQNQDGISYMISHLFITRRLFYGLSLAQITYVFSLFLSSGVDIAQAFHYLEEMQLHPQLAKAIKDSKTAMDEGVNFAQAMRKGKLYIGMEASMLEVGYRSGKQDQVMRQLADRYEQRVEQSIIAFLNIIEPTIVAILSIIVGMVLLSVMLPLMGIMSSAG